MDIAIVILLDKQVEYLRNCFAINLVRVFDFHLSPSSVILDQKIYRNVTQRRGQVGDESSIHRSLNTIQVAPTEPHCSLAFFSLSSCFPFSSTLAVSSLLSELSPLLAV
ncbi:hypothetical protein T4B_1194 [Trichinella pseudospiralis]|uniref:Uncharacterized protein n=1 Tax=Trichinella pseudospiralis TaxID=6337 RepID=A0A0V1I119_TRIPS|nr:hypothetical protein T4B_1194 [Trichinella pseudospiralis]